MEERSFSTILKKLKSDDILIISEISRMGRNLMQIMSVLGNIKGKHETSTNTFIVAR